MLEIHDLKVSYGVVDAIKGVSMHVEEGEIVSLIGANGAGKTTILRAISGLKKAEKFSLTGRIFERPSPAGLSPCAWPMCRREGTFSPR